MEWSLPDSGVRQQHVIYAARDTSVAMLSNFPHLLEEGSLFDPGYKSWFFVCVRRKMEWRAHIMARGTDSDYVQRILGYVRRNEALCLEQFDYIVKTVSRLANQSEIEQAARVSTNYLLSPRSKYAPAETRLIDYLRDLVRMQYALDQVILPLRPVMALVPEVLPIDPPIYFDDDEVTEPDGYSALVRRA